MTGTPVLFPRANSVRQACASEGLLRVLQGLLATEVVSLDAAMQRASRDLASILAADKVDVFVYDPTSRELVAVGTSDLPMGRLQHALGLDRLPAARGGRAGHIFRTGQPALIGRADADPEELPDVITRLGVRSSVGVPLSIVGERRGVVVAASATPSFFTERDLSFLEAVAQWIELVGSRLALTKRLSREATDAAHRARVEDTLARLTPRQREVAALISRGLTNAEIAERLVLSGGTVANHIEHMLRRLGFSRRTQIATLIASLERRDPSPSASQ